MADSENQKQLPRIRDPQYREIYSNSSLTQLSPFDVSLIFQKMSEIMPGQMAAVDIISVSFSPQHFKALANSINQTLKAYEAAFGELTIPDSDTASLKTADEIISVIKENRDKMSNQPLKEEKSSLERKKPLRSSGT